MKKEVKIIGLKLNHQFGILQSCKLMFDQENKLISVKGEVGSGKTSLQKALQLGTLGTDTLKDDKSLYGGIDQEVKLKDGVHSIYVGCKTNSKGAIDYILYSKDEDGKKIKDPVVDGVKLTPATYLKSLQTGLTWRMDELTSENTTIQKKLLLEIYKKELSKVGVIFDKSSNQYEDSILGKIDEAINYRGQKEYERKKVGGFKNQLEEIGIDSEDEGTWPVEIDISELENKKIKKQVARENIDSEKENKLSALKNKGDNLLIELKKGNSEALEQVIRLRKIQSGCQEKHDQIIENLKFLEKHGAIDSEVRFKIEASFKIPFKNKIVYTLVFEENGKLITTSNDWKGSTEILILLKDLDKVRVDYKAESNRESGNTTEIDEEIENISTEIVLAQKTNHKAKMLNSFLDWQKANNEVVKLRNEYFDLLGSIDTGVDGLRINVEKEDEKMDIYLSYDGTYDPVYFGNKEKQQRKLSSYSGTQKPMICLLLQSYLLSKKEKALRYLWIDNVPIDNKTKILLNEMGEKLDVTIMVNITGDFSKETLENGDILLDGGEIFFK